MSRFYTVKEAIDIRLLGNDDLLKRDKLRLMKWAPHVWRDLNLSTVKLAVRKKYAINKRTNTIDLDCNFLQLSSVNVVDKCGIEYPVYRSKQIFENDDLVDINASSCEKNCNSRLCNIIKGYEAVQSTKTDYMPDGTEVSFECVDRKWLDDHGFLYEQLQYPQRVYLSGVWVDTVLHTEDKKLCQVEVDDKGCVCDTEENIDKVCNACGYNEINPKLCCVGGDANTPPSPDCDTWVYYCPTKMSWLNSQFGGFNYSSNNIYNITELGNRIIFPPNFGWDHVVLRFYEDDRTGNIHIPAIALDTFVVGLMWWDSRFNDRKQKLADKFGRDYGNLKLYLLKEMNKYRIAELAAIIAPRAYIPSYIIGFSNRYEGSLRSYYARY